MKVKAKEIDLRSLIIGFLLATVLFMFLAAGSGTQDVRIVAASSSIEVPVKIADVGYRVKIPVEIKDQPITVKTR